MNNKKTSEFLKFLGLQNTTSNQEIETEQEEKIVKCPKCKKTLEDIKNTSYIDCDDCYDVFNPIILDKLRKITGEHLPKKEDKINLNILIKKLNKIMKKEIELENYEYCSVLKNKIDNIRNFQEYIFSQDKIIKTLVKSEKYESANEIKKEITEKTNQIIQETINYLQ